ncbi:MAG: NADH-quinone oxidoreductase subunit L [Thermoleophilia bacterium]|nr:NADH-quinone oxidoreductase subunit L [Thermoleophilia bacterium]
MSVAAWIALASPALAVVAIALAGERLSGRVAGYTAAGSALVAFAASVAAFGLLLARDADDRSQTSTLWTWLSAGDFRVGLELLVDPLAVFMMLVVSGVGFLILTYAIGYMAGDVEERRYHAYKALFLFSMLLLVQGGNLLLLLAGWGMVGLSSYLLINFWHERTSAVRAGKKAFVINAAGDATFALALFLLVQKTGTLELGRVFAAAPEVLGEGSAAAVLVALGLLGGALAKSAQVPLHTWLPDAMEGPTPVSALIHAATMVTAGVYLIARASPLFELAPDIQHLAAILGAVTIILAGLVALVQTDIKRVIAYSTMSQIGYMFVGVGLGAYGAGLFHLMTHAFFKALLFMAAGVVIHALAGEQDIRRMGGLGRELPWTYRATLVGALALAAVPPLSGFWSKDAVLASALEAGTLGRVLWAVAAAGAFLTALYTFRMVFVVFGRQRSPFVQEHLHRERWEGPGVMMWPVALLSLLALVGGILQIPGLWHAVDDWIHPVAESAEEATGTTFWFSLLVSVALSLAGIALAWALYRRPTAAPARLARSAPWAARTLENKFFFDDAYDVYFYEPASQTASFLERFLERPVVLASLTDLGATVRGTSRRLSAAQTGVVRSYVLALALGLAVLAVVFLVVG